MCIFLFNFFFFMKKRLECAFLFLREFISRRDNLESDWVGSPIRHEKVDTSIANSSEQMTSGKQ